MNDYSIAERVRRKVAQYTPVKRRDITLTAGALSITFDDIPRSAWTVGGAILERHGVLGTYYVCGGLESATYRDLPHFGLEDLRRMRAAGHEIGCHTFDHLSALREPAARFQDSIVRNRAYMETALPGYEMQSFSFPFGDVSLANKLYVGARFRSARGVNAGLNGPAAELMLLYAQPLEERLRGTFDLAGMIARAARERRWLILLTHDVADHPSPYGCRPDDLESAIVLAKQAGLTVAPVAAVLDQAHVA